MLEDFEGIEELFDVDGGFGSVLSVALRGVDEGARFHLVFVLLALAGFLFVTWVNRRFRRELNRYIQIPSRNGYTGVSAARQLLERAGVLGVRIVPTYGSRVTDHYHPLTKELALSHGIFHSSSLAAVGIAAHEVGHAVQHARNYFPAWLRLALVPATRICFTFGLTAACFGWLYSSSLAWVGVGLFAGCLLFHLVNLPVEFNASARARELAVAAGIIHVEERAGMDRVLRAAALTYVGKTFAAGLVFLGVSFVPLFLPVTPMSLTWEDSPGTGVIMILGCIALAWSAQGRRLKRTKAPGVHELDNTGNLQASQGDYVPAIAAFTKALQLDPRRADVYANRGVCYYHTKQYDEALADLDTSIRLAPGRAEAYIWRGHVRYGRGEYDQAMEDYDAALKLDPNSAEVLKNRGRAWLERGEQDRARLDFDRVLALEPKDASSYFNRGITWFQLEDFDRALADFNQAITHDGRQSQGYAMRGNVWLVKGEHDRAIEDYNEALRRGGDRSVILRDRGLAWFRKRDWDQAVRDLNESIELNAEDAVTYNNRGATFQKKGSYARALSDLQQALRLNPNLPNTYKNLAWLQATCPEPQFRDGTAAVANASRALELSKGKEPAWLEILAAAQAEAGNFEEAVRLQVQRLADSPAEHKADLQARLDLYRTGQPLRESPAVRD